jgi:cell division protein FtsL
MIVKKTLGFFSLRNLLLVVTGVLVLYMGSSFVQQAGAHLQRQEELDQLDQQLAAALREEAQLEEELLYVQSPGAAEAWARENGWARSDEASVVVIAPEADASRQEEQDPRVGDSPESRRQLWWDFFFGER